MAPWRPSRTLWPPPCPMPLRASPTLPSVTEEPSARGADPASDHAAVVATFTS